MRKPTFWFPTRSDTNQAVQPQKIVRGLKFRISVVEGLYYPYSEKKALISFAVTAKLICVFVFANAKIRFFHDTAHICYQTRLIFDIHCNIFSFDATLFMPPPFEECGRALSVAHVRASVRASIRPSFKWVLCERNSSYNFIPILLKLYRCFCQGLKMCMTFGYNPQINFCHFFHSLNLVIFGLNYY